MPTGGSQSIFLRRQVAEGHVRTALIVVSPPSFDQLARLGEFFIGWLFDEGNSGDVFDHRLLARLADMNIDLSFDVYADEPSDQ
jgi:hypothetical protein